MKKSLNVLLVMLLVIALTLPILPENIAYATNADDNPSSYNYEETDADSVTVYVTISNDGKPLIGDDENKTKLANLKVEIPYFDLDNYGLSEFYRYQTSDGSGPYVNKNLIKRPTTLHLYLYLLERFYLGTPKDKCGVSNSVSGVMDFKGTQNVKYFDGSDAYQGKGNALKLSGSPTSMYMTTFWGHDENLLYYRNHRFPLMSDGWGACADYMLLSDGDKIDLAISTDWSAYQRGAFVTFNKDEYNSKQGEKLNVKTMSTATQAVGNGDETPIQNFSEPLNLSLYNDKWEKIDTSITSKGDGEYIIDLPKDIGKYYLVGMDPKAGTIEASYSPAVASIQIKDKIEEKPKVELKDLSFDKEKIVMKKGDSSKLTAILSPKDATDINIKWSVEDGSVASIEKDTTTTKERYVVKGLAKGETRVKAEANGKKAECVVNVFEPETSEPYKDADGNYLIANAENFKWFTDAINGNKIPKNVGVKLTDDIDLSSVCGKDLKTSWTPIQKFYGKFDGQGHEIKNLYIDDSVDKVKNENVGLFGLSKKETDGDILEIKNLSVSGTINVSDRDTVGSIVAWIFNDGNIENCTSDVQITTKDKSNKSVAFAAGIVGRASGKKLHIKNCVNKGDIYRNNGPCAGVIGFASANISVENTVNAGTIRSDEFRDGSAAGVAGLVSRSSSTLKIKNSYNVGEVISNATKAGERVGGLVGITLGSGDKKIVFENCYNAGKLTIASKDKTDYGATIGKNVGDEATLQNVFYLNSTSDKDAVGSVAKTENELKSKELLTKLGSGYKEDTKNVNHGYPVLIANNDTYVSVTEIKLNIYKTELLADKTLSLIASIAPENATYKNIEWSSSNKELVTVDQNGNVTPKNETVEGDVVITAKGDNEKEAHCKITIKPVKHIKNIKIDRDELYMFKGEAMQLNASAIPEDASYKNINWTSKDKGVAFVDKSGKVYATGLGKTEITATAEGVEKKCKVIVTNKDGSIDVSGFYKNTEFKALYYTDKSDPHKKIPLVDITNKKISNYAGEKPAYKLVLPKTAEKVYITLPADTDIGGQACKYMVSNDGPGNVGWDSAEGDLVKTTDASGDKLVEIKVESYIDASNGIALQNTSWFPVMGFEFVSGTPTDLSLMFKDVLKGKIKTYKNKDDYRDPEKEKIDSIIAGAISEIDSAKENQIAMKSMENAMKMLDELKTDDELVGEEIVGKELVIETNKKFVKGDITDVSKLKFKIILKQRNGNKLERIVKDNDTVKYDKEKNELEITIDNQKYVFKDAIKFEPLKIVMDNSTYIIGSRDTIVIKCNGNIEAFKHINLDGKKIQDNNYTVEKGSTIITLNNDYLNSLQKGTHKVELVYNGENKVAIDLTIVEKDSSTEYPNIGDATNNKSMTNIDKNNNADGVSTGDSQCEIIVLLSGLLVGSLLILSAYKRKNMF